MKRDILNWQNVKIGELELPDNTPEEIWEKKLAPYKVAPPSEQEILDSRLRYSIKDRKIWAEDMMERFKKRNIESGINALQSLWLHHRMRALEINFSGVPMTLDILNMAVSGDIETACIALMYSSVDSGFETQHWYVEDTKNWLVNEMKQYLGWA